MNVCFTCKRRSSPISSFFTRNAPLNHRLNSESPCMTFEVGTYILGTYIHTGNPGGKGGPEADAAGGTFVPKLFGAICPIALCGGIPDAYKRIKPDCLILKV